MFKISLLINYASIIISNSKLNENFCNFMLNFMLNFVKIKF